MHNCLSFFLLQVVDKYLSKFLLLPRFLFFLLLILILLLLCDPREDVAYGARFWAPSSLTPPPPPPLSR